MVEPAIHSSGLMRGPDDGGYAWDGVEQREGVASRCGNGLDHQDGIDGPVNVSLLGEALADPCAVGH